MRFLLDENVDVRVAEFLEQQGHDAAAITRDYPHALPDHEVLAVAVRTERILITHDRDFGELVMRRGHQHAGVIYLRVQPPEIGLVLSRIAELLRLPPERLHEFLVVTRTRIRRR